MEGEREEVSSAIGYGLTLAKAAGAHLTLQSASWRLSGDDAWLGQFDYEGLSVLDRRLDALARSIAERSAGDAAQTGVICTTEAPSLPYPEIVSHLATRARRHDLTVLNIGPRTYDLDRKMVEKALFHSGRPLIAVPLGHDAFVVRRIMAAWDGSAQAARAANNALPFLRAAEAVEMVSAGTETEYTPRCQGPSSRPTSPAMGSMSASTTCRRGKASPTPCAPRPVCSRQT